MSKERELMVEYAQKMTVMEAENTQFASTIKQYEEQMQNVNSAFVVLTDKCRAILGMDKQQEGEQPIPIINLLEQIEEKLNGGKTVVQSESTDEPKKKAKKTSKAKTAKKSKK
jgi:hypothetical protein